MQARVENIWNGFEMLRHVTSILFICILKFLNSFTRHAIKLINLHCTLHNSVNIPSKNTIYAYNNRTSVHLKYDMQPD